MKFSDQVSSAKYSQLQHLIIVLLLCFSLASNIFIYWQSYLALPTNGHIWRQTQTLIPVLFMNGDWASQINNPWFPQIIPTLGYPWRIIIEFPIFQWLASFISIIFSVDGLFSARLVCFLSSLLSVFFLYRILKSCFDSMESKMGVCLLLGSPLYAYWGSSVILIDQFTCFTSILASYFFLFFLHNNKPMYFMISLVFSVVGVISKFTISFMIIYALIILVVINMPFQLKYLRSIFYHIAATLIVFVCWVFYMQWYTSIGANSTLMINTTSPLNDIGVMAFRDANFKSVFFQRLITWLFFDFFGTISGAVIFLNIVFFNTIYDFRKRNLLSLLVIFSVISTNITMLSGVYYVHNYYQYASSIIIACFLTASFSKLPIMRNINLVVVAAVVIVQAYSLHQNIHPTHEPVVNDLSLLKDKPYAGKDRIDVGQFLLQQSKDSRDFFISQGLGYDPTINYFSRMFSIDDRSQTFDSQLFMNTLAITLKNGYQLKFLLRCYNYKSISLNLPSYLVIGEKLFSNDACDVYKLFYPL